MRLFAHLIQNLLLALVNAAASSVSLAAYVQVKRREGVLSRFPSHVGIHFCKDLAASSFAGPFLFDDDVLARIIASSCEDSHLDAQLSIAKAFKLPVFRGAGNADRKASNQRSEASSSSSSGPGVEEVVTWKITERSVRLLLVLGRAILPRLPGIPLPLVKGSRIFANRRHVPAQQ